MQSENKNKNQKLKHKKTMST